MFGIGLPEVLVILVVCLFIFDAKSLPKIARSLGKAAREFRKAQSSLTDEGDKYTG